MRIDSIIFDLDGTLVDSMWVWHQIDIDYLSKKGHAVPDNLTDETKEIKKQICGFFGIKEEAVTIEII